MLNNLTNFFNIIKGRRIKTKLEKKDLIAVGTKQSSALGDYKPTAITFEDLQSQLAGLQTVAVDGVTITGTGVPGDPLVASIPSSSVNYSNVAFVDLIFGNNSTAITGRFDKPFSSISSAKYAVAVTATANSRGLVYIRKGTYSTNEFFLDSAFVDYYCEPGVVFTAGLGYFITPDTNWYGHAVFTQNSTVRSFNNGNVRSTFEFEKADVTGQFINMETGTSGVLNVKCTSIKTGINPPTQFGINLRGTGNYTFNVSDFIEGGNQIFGVRFASGRIVVNCPKIIIDDQNNISTFYKGAFAFYENSNVDVVVNGNIYSNETFYRGGTAAAVLFWQGGLQTFTLNGNIYGGFSMGLNNGWANPNSKMIINGSISSRTQAIYSTASSTVLVKDGFITGPVDLTAPLVRLTNDTKIFFVNVGFKHNNADQDVIFIEKASVNLNVQNCLAQSEGSAGEFVNSTVPVNVRIHNTRANKALNVNVTDILTPSGFINDSQTQVFNF